jgi:autotransporter-associated beta strand protein
MNTRNLKCGKFLTKVMLPLLLCLGLLLTGATSQAAQITWGAPTAISGTNDVYLGGTTNGAYTWGSSGQSVRTVPFVKTITTNGTSGNLTLSGFASTSLTNFGSASSPYASLPSTYATILQGADYESSGATVTVTLNNLKIGTNYAVQVWINDSRGGSGVGTNRNALVQDNSGGTGVTLVYNTTAVGGGLGQYAIGKFTADATSQDVTITGGMIVPGVPGETASSQLTAIALRDLSPTNAASPTFSPAPNPQPGSDFYFGAQNITVSSEIGSTVFYTTNGNNPDYNSAHGAVGSGFAILNIPAGAPTTIIALATNDTKLDSLLVTNTYTTLATTTATWTTLGGGSWTNTANWQSGYVANGANATADFSTVSLSAAAIVTLDKARTVGGLWFDDKSGNNNPWTVTNSGLTLVVDSGSPIISNNVQVTISTAGLSGTQGFTKTGSGKLVARPSPSTISGNAYIENGTLELGGTGIPLTGVTFVLGTANSGSAKTTLRLSIPANTTGNGSICGTPIVINSAAPSSSTAVIEGNPNSTTNGNLNATITLQGGRSVMFTNSGPPTYTVNRNISGTGDVIASTTSYANRIRLNPSNPSTNNSWVGNLIITNGGVQISDGTGSVLGSKNAIPDTSDVIMAANTTLSFGANETFGALNGTAGAIVGEDFPTNGTAFNMTLGANNHDGIFNGTIWLHGVGANANANMPLQLTKIGTGTQTFNGNCSNTAPTYVGGGSLVINGNYSASAITVSNNATLGGAGTLAGALTVQLGGTLAPGTTLLGTLAVNNSLTSAGNLIIKVDKSQLVQSNDFVNVSGTLNNSGTGTVTMTNVNANPSFAFAANDKFTLFSKPLANGSAMTILPATPGPNLAWTNNLESDGSIGVYSTVPAPSTNAFLANLVISPAGALNPAFATNNLSYTATNAYLNNPVTVTAYAADPGATLELSFNGGAFGPLTSGVASSPQTLVLPANTVAVKVTAADATTTQTYNLSVTLQPSLAPANLMSSVGSSTLTLSWPADHLGWCLQAQTNGLDVGIKPDGWMTIPGSDLVTQTNISISPTEPAVSFRLQYPTP